MCAQELWNNLSDTFLLSKVDMDKIPRGSKCFKRFSQRPHLLWFLSYLASMQISLDFLAMAENYLGEKWRFVALNCRKKAIKKEARDPWDFSKNTNLQNLFGILYTPCIPHEIPARDMRSISRAWKSSHFYFADTQEAKVSLPGKTILHML